MRNLKKYAGACARLVEVFGDIIVMDHCSFHDQGMNYALSGHVIALVARGMATTFGSVFPPHTKGTEEIATALRSFIGDARVKRFSPDLADELCNPARYLTAPHKASQQGMAFLNGKFKTWVRGRGPCWSRQACLGKVGRMRRHATCILAIAPLHPSRKPSLARSCVGLCYRSGLRLSENLHRPMVASLNRCNLPCMGFVWDIASPLAGPGRESAWSRASATLLG